MFTFLLSVEQLNSWSLRRDYVFQRRWIYVGRLVSFEIASADLPTMLEEDRIASYNFSKAWPYIHTQLTQRIPYKRRYNLDRPASPVVWLWGIYGNKARRCVLKSKQKYTETTGDMNRVQTVQSRRFPLSTRFASKTSIASSKHNVVATAMPVPLPMEQLEYDPSINQLLLKTSHRSNVFCFSCNFCKLCECEWDP